MNQATHNKIISFIWSIADDVLRDLFKRVAYQLDLLRRVGFRKSTCCTRIPALLRSVEKKAIPEVLQIWKDSAQEH